MENEIWKDIPEYKGYYQVSNLGRIKRLETIIRHPTGADKFCRERILKLYSKENKYSYVVLSMTHKKSFTIHRLVAKQFIPNPKNLPCVNHIDGNKHNNRVENLEWVTYSENEIHSHEVLGKKTATPWKGITGGEFPGSKPLICLNDGKEFPSAIEAEKFYNIRRQSINRVARGQQKQVWGFRFQYAV